MCPQRQPKKPNQTTSWQTTLNFYVNNGHTGRPRYQNRIISITSPEKSAALVRPVFFLHPTDFCDIPRGDSAGAQLPLIQNVIDALMAASAQIAGDDHQSRVKLARLEYRMRCCREAILRRNAMTN